ncbi:MAG: VWA domain-containing protein [Kofleriaceae bacterium]
MPPPFLIVLDRSCSMKNQLVPNTNKDRWQVAVEALTAAVTTHDSTLAFGLTLFPDTIGMACAQDAIPLPVAPQSGAAINALLTAALDPNDPLYPDDPCVTNIDTGMAQALADPAIAATGTRYVMLVTDGAQSGTPDGVGANNCGGANGDARTQATIEQLRADGITTFVVGFGGNVDTTALNAFAIAGGAPQSGSKKFYAAESPAELAQTFASIVERAASCEYTVDPPPPDIDQTYVFFGNTELVDRDTTHTQGWDYDPATMTLTFYGSACERVSTHAVTDIDVVFGCPAPPIL